MGNLIKNSFIDISDNEVTIFKKSEKGETSYSIVGTISERVALKLVGKMRVKNEKDKIRNEYEIKNFKNQLAQQGQENINNTIMEFGECVEKVARNIPQEKLGYPNEEMYNTIIKSLLYSRDDEFVKKVYSNLVAATMHEDLYMYSNISFVDIVKQLNPIDAVIFRNIAQYGVIAVAKVMKVDMSRWKEIIKSFSELGIENYTEEIILRDSNIEGEDVICHCVLSEGIKELEHQYVEISISNLCRLGLLEVTYTEELQKYDYKEFLKNKAIKECMRNNTDDNCYKIIPGKCKVNSFGKAFIKSCLDV